MLASPPANLQYVTQSVRLKILDVLTFWVEGQLSDFDDDLMVQ